MMPSVTIEGQRAMIRFEDFDQASYARFLQVKQLPEKQTSCEWRDGRPVYTVTTSARFADRLGVASPPSICGQGSFSDFLHDYQDHFLARALIARRYACWWDCGLGKTLFQLEFGLRVVIETRGRFLHFAPLNVIPQTLAEARRWYGGRLPIRWLRTRRDLEAFLRGDGDIATGICNYELLDDGPLVDLRNMAGISADESSMLKTGGGVRKWNLIKSAKGIEFKLSLTATPAPNDVMEFASQASFCETILTPEDVIWTFFSRRDGGDWEVKPHARPAFYDYLCGFSSFLRNPAAYGFRDNLRDIPAPEWIEHPIEATREQLAVQRDVEHRFGASNVKAAQGALDESGDAEVSRQGIVGRGILAQAASGFLYGADGTRRIDSRWGETVAAIARAELERGNQTIIWTQFDEEADILMPLLPRGWFEIVDGRTKPRERERIFDRTLSGEAGGVVTKYGIWGFGRNMQHMRSQSLRATDSFEQHYQGVRRSFRYGQTEICRFHQAYVPALEGPVFANLQRKSRDFETQASAMEQSYRRALGMGEAV